MIYTLSGINGRSANWTIAEEQHDLCDFIEVIACIPNARYSIKFAIRTVNCKQYYYASER